MIKVRFRFSILLIILLLIISFILISCSSADEKKSDEVSGGKERELTSLHITRGDTRLVINNPFIFKTLGTDDNMFFVDNMSEKTIVWEILNLDDTEATGITFKDDIDNQNEVQISFSNAGDYKIITTWIDDTTDKEYKGLKKITIYESATSEKFITSIVHDTQKKGVMNFKAVTIDNSKTFKWKISKFNSIEEIKNIITTDTELETAINFTDQPVGIYILSFYVLDGDKQIDDYEGSVLISDTDNFSIAIGDNHTLIADKNSDLLYVYGVNDNGQLGTGDNDNLTTPTILKNKNISFIKEVSTGFNHSLLLTGDGKDVGIHQNYRIYSWGDNTYGQLGISEDDTIKNVNTPAVVVEMKAEKEDGLGGGGSDDNIIPATKYFNGIGAGGDQSFAYSNYQSPLVSNRKNSMLAQWGRVEGETVYSRIPKYVSEGPRGGVEKGNIQFLAVGTNHIIFRNTWAFNVASFGSNSHGQAGKCDVVEFGTAKCTKVGGDILTGNGDYHGAGYRPVDWYYLYYHYVYAPRSENGANVGYVVDVRLASAGDNFSLLIREDGSLYSFGQNNKGQLGLGKDKEVDDGGVTTKTKNKFQPIKVFQGGGGQGETVERKERIVDIATGYSHSYAIDKTGKLFAWGDNSKGQLLSVPLTPTEISDIPTEIKIVDVETILDIWAGANRSIALGSDKNLYTWGENKGVLKLLGVEEVGTDKEFHAVPVKLMFPLADIGH